MNSASPVIVGVGEIGTDGSADLSLRPMDLAASAAAAALADTQIEGLATHIDQLMITRLFADSSPLLDPGFGRAQNPPAAVARRINANPKALVYGAVGGHTPQRMINEASGAIALGRVNCVLICGAELGHTQAAARKRSVTLNWDENSEEPFLDAGVDISWVTPNERAHGVGPPITTYPLFETALRHDMDLSVSDHLKYMAARMAGLSEIAVGRPLAQYPGPWSATQLASIDAANPYVVYPYPKLMNAREKVDMGAAVLLMSLSKAQSLGIPSHRWVFVHGCGDCDEPGSVLEYASYTESQTAAAAAGAAFRQARITPQQIEFVDLYSCFPSAIEVARRATGITQVDGAALSLTGGLPFFGGAGNNYATHSITQAVAACRSHTNGYALVSANGGCLTKHSVGVYSAQTPDRVFRREIPATYAPLDQRETVTQVPSGRATIETAAVMLNGPGPPAGIVIGRLDGTHQRFVANTPTSDSVLDVLMADEVVGRRGRVTCHNGRAVFLP